MTRAESKGQAGPPPSMIGTSKKPKVLQMNIKGKSKEPQPQYQNPREQHAPKYMDTQESNVSQESCRKAKVLDYAPCKNKQSPGQRSAEPYGGCIPGLGCRYIFKFQVLLPIKK